MYNKRALMVLTSTPKYATVDKATGLWLAEAVHFYHPLKHHGWEIDFVSPKGGVTPIDPVSLAYEMPEEDKVYLTDVTFQGKLNNTLTPSQVNPDDYSVIYYAGGHGVIFDFLENQQLEALSRKIYEKGGIVASVCHGAVGLINIKLSNGEYLVKDKKLTGFSNEEEVISKMDKHVPFMTEDELKKHGANYVQGPVFTPFCVTDGHLITGQNPQSTHAVAEAILKVTQ